jgi:hypothetical protein
MTDKKPKRAYKKIAEKEATLEAVLVERKKLAREKFPDIDIGDFVVLKSGPLAYKVATHWVLVDRNTSEFHHHALKIETYRKRKDGWEFDEEHSITLADKDDKEITALASFLGTVLSLNMPGEPGGYLVVPLQAQGEGYGITEENLDKVLGLANVGIEPLIRLTDWLINSGDSAAIVERLESLNIDNLRKLNTVVGVSSLKNLLSEWKANTTNDDEEFWQQKLMENAFVLSQVFSFPIFVLKGKAYLGGKGIENKGGNVIDFLCANHLTHNAVLIEIKTPETKLLGSKYRDIINVSVELSGSVLQIANYKNSLMREYDRLAQNSSSQFEAFDPRCLVILGNSSSQLKTSEQRKTFELFRGGLKDVEVITFDELFRKIETLLNVLEGTFETTSNSGE